MLGILVGMDQKDSYAVTPVEVATLTVDNGSCMYCTGFCLYSRTSRCVLRLSAGPLVGLLNSVEDPQLQFIVVGGLVLDKVVHVPDAVLVGFLQAVDVPVVVQRQVRDRVSTDTVEAPQFQYFFMVVDAPVVQVIDKGFTLFGLCSDSSSSRPDSWRGLRSADRLVRGVWLRCCLLLVLWHFSVSVQTDVENPGGGHPNSVHALAFIDKDIRHTLCQQLCAHIGSVGFVYLQHLSCVPSS